jgi:hypothetical protein
MENNTCNYNEFSAFIEIGSENYAIYNNDKRVQSSSITIDNILENISVLKEKSDFYIQKIIDNNKFLLQQEKKPKKDEDEEIVDNIDEENQI